MVRASSNSKRRGSASPYTQIVLFIGAALSALGCSNIDELLGDTCTYPALPDPSPRLVDAPVFTEDQQRRDDEAKCLVAQFYAESGWSVLKTVQTPGGDIIDYLDPASVPGSEIEPPPLPEYMLPTDILEQHAEIEDLGDEFRGPPGSVPMIRPAFAPYVFGDVEAASLEEFIAQQVPGVPAGASRLYAGIVLPVQNTGAAMFVSAYEGTVYPRTVSLLEMSVTCTGVDADTTLELVGVAASRDRYNFDRTTPTVTRLQVEFYSAGYKIDNQGPGKGGWEGMALRKGTYKGQVVTGFVGHAGAPYAPGVILTPVSAIGGPIYESRFEIHELGGNWWIAHNGHWLGYYPREAFDLIPFGACTANWYGENWNHALSAWTESDMGSGHFATDGFGNAAQIRLPLYLDSGSLPQLPNGAQPATPYDPLCYSSSGVLDESATRGLGFERIMYVGGPGGDSPGCVYAQ